MRREWPQVCSTDGKSNCSPTEFWRLRINTGPERNKDQERIEKLQQKIRLKDEVLAELMVEHVALKKELGEL